MAYLKIWKDGKLIKEKQIDEAKAQKGYKINLGSDRSVILKTGETKTIGKYKIEIIAESYEQAEDSEIKPLLEIPEPQTNCSKPPTTTNFFQEYRLLVSIAAIVLVVLVGAALFSYIKMNKSRAKVNAVQQELETQKKVLTEKYLAAKEKADNDLQEFGGKDIKKFTLSGDELFGPGSAKIKPAAIVKIKGIAQQIERNYTDCEVLIAGYTDTDKLLRAETKKLFQDNWGLGSQRALAVLRILQTEGIQGPKLSAISRGPFHPKQTKAESRRVEIVLRLPADGSTLEQSSDEQIVRRLAQDFVDGFVASDSVLFDGAMNLLADNFTGIMSTGTVVRGKQKAIELYRQAAEYLHRGTENIKIDYQIESVKQTANSATVFGKLTLSGQVEKNSQSFSSNIWETLAFQKINGSWRLTMEHSTGVDGKSSSQQAKEQLAAGKNDVKKEKPKENTDDFPLHEAASAGDIEKVKEILAKGYDVDARNEQNWTALHNAVQRGYKEVAELLIANGADVNAKTNLHMTPLLFAVTEPVQEDMAKLLIANGAQVDIFVASAQGDAERVAELLKNDPALINAWNGDFSALHWAAYSGHLDVIELLIENDTNVDIAKEDGATPLFWAVLKGRLDAGKFLIDKGADVNIRIKGGSTILHNSGSLEIAELLIANGADVNTKNEHGMTPLHSLAYKNGLAIVQKVLFWKNAGTAASWETDFKKHRHAAAKVTAAIAELLITNGADINAEDNKGHTPLFYAEKAKNKALMNYLKDVTKKDKENNKEEKAEGDTDDFPLHGAAAKGDIEKVNELIAEGYDVDTRNSVNETPLHCAATGGQKDVVELLIAKGANVNAKNKARGWTPLYGAIIGDHKDVAELLIAKGANINTKGTFVGMTPLGFAVADGRSEMAKLLITKGAQVDIFVATGMGDFERVNVFLRGDPALINAIKADFTLLHQAAYCGQVKMTEFLINKGLDINAGSPEKPTPLYWAVRKGHLDVVELLIAKGADVNAKTKNSDTLFSLAKATKNEALIELLEKHIESDIDKKETVSEQQVKEIQEAISGSICGIGVNISEVEEGVVIDKVIAEQSRKAGLVPGDVITAVEGKSIAGITRFEAARLIKGPEGSVVKLTVRNPQGRTRNVEVVRAKFDVSHVDSRILENNIGLIQFNFFSKNTAENVQKAIDEFSGKGVSGIILDLRGHKGLFYPEVIELADIFIPPQKTLWYFQKPGKDYEQVKTKTPQLTKIPVVLLVNEKTEGATEMLAVSFKQTRRGTLIGRKTFGKAPAAKFVKQADGSTQRVTIAEFFVRPGQPISGRGILPNIKMPADATPEQFIEKAVLVLQNKIKSVQ